MSESKHWYLLSYMVQQPGLWTPSSAVVGSDTKELSIPQLNALKKAHKIPDNSVLIGVSYLGLQTEKRINGLPEIDPPTVPTDAFRLGMIAATRVSAQDPSQPVNPFVEDGTPQTRAKAAEWQEGLIAVRQAQQDRITEVRRLELPKPEQQNEVSSVVKPGNTRQPKSP